MKNFLLILLAILLPCIAMAQQPSNDPVEITADTLTVLRDENKGVFKGDVIAVQGKMKLRANQMTVYFAKKQSKKSQISQKLENKIEVNGEASFFDTKPKSSVAAKQSNKISKIEVLGNVRLTTSKESAQGNKGIYNVRTETFTLTGDVVLKQGKHMLKGSKLVYNRKTGKSVLSSAYGKHNVEKGSGRVKGVFVPEQGDGR